ncbi:MAG: aminotransferase class V-fold PLP-dependent enzyme [Gemmatimonadetes bacterium]|nr:aminotransferase class V-fold PLP-dependent enzyme [Gemmatimonadota bacterium]
MECQREAFSLPPDLHYLNCAYIGPLPRASEEAGVEGLRLKRDPTSIAARDFFSGVELLRERFAALVGGRDPSRVAVLPSTSYGIAIAARNLPVARGQTIVVSHEQFPGNVYAWRRVASERGAEVVTVRPPGGAERGKGWNERFLDAIDARTAVVALPHVHWTDGTRFDLAAIAARARDVGAALVVDGTQSVGALPFDVEELRPDLLVAATYKWLLGPYSLALAWMGPRFDDGVPLEETWVGRAGSDDFQHLVDYRDEYRPGAARYDVGETSNWTLVPVATRSLEMLLEWRPERVQAYCRALTAGLLEVVGRRGFSVEEDAWRGQHLFGIRMRPDVELADLKAELDRAGVVASLRGTALRVSPNVYNDEGDVAALAEVLERT